ncbi:hypothetical protein PLESTB_000592800 [Pleodorina starrii]|uniref:AAA+ ATPase domain-containing protein n=1 Tax=Pleodorina starrii TaxID=330485 RepID=A0A9W6F1H6_9CHLO|nr:hypothetical protein PLESTM_000765900 [Pleodorina starrii]GLC52186.1 hypothetical protein PLESTB_000592800 [Pleodorina starrii]GLC75816.1 hypothetical protein PLESTF_001690800 [Pleodorina starrii]
MKCEPDETVVEQHREVLRSLSRRELQARAKALGVRANGKSVEIIDTVAKAISRPASPVKSPDLESEVDDDRENGDRYGDASAKQEKLPTAVGVAQPQGVSLGPSAMDCSEADGSQQNETPPASATMELSIGGTAAGPKASSTACTSIRAGGTPSVSAHAPPVTTPGPLAMGSLAELAARASAATLAASLHNLRFESELKVGALKTSPALLRPDVRQPLLGNTMRCSPDRTLLDQLPQLVASSQEGTQQLHLLSGETDGPHDQPGAVAGGTQALGAEEEPARRLTFAFSPLPLNGNQLRATSPLRRQDEDAQSSPVEFQARGASSTPILKSAASALTCTSDAGRDGKNACGPASKATSAAPSSLELSVTNSEAAAEAAAPSPGPAGLTFAAAPEAAGAAANTPAVVRPAASFVTDRTPARQHRLLAPLLQPLCAAVATPAGRGGVAAPRTPGTGLRTPARRVPVITDEAKERAMDEWVTQNLVTPAGSPTAPAGLSWGELVGLHDVKQRLQAICVNTAAGEDFPSPSATVRVIGGGSTSTATSASKVSRTAGQARTTRLPNGAVLVCGPFGIGKSHLARALAVELGAAYLHVPPDLHCRVAREPGGAEVVARAVARVATQLPGPVVVHLEDVDQLAGMEAARDGQDRRRLRTELLVAIDELLLQPPGPAASPGQSGPLTARGASPASSSGRGASAAEARGSGDGACKSRFKVLVVSTTSRPMDLDAALAASLGRTDRLLAALPGAEDREMYLFGRLASEDAALGVEHLDRLVRRTEGFSFAQLAALCDDAVKAAAARRVWSQAHGPTPLSEEDIQAALQHILTGTRSGAEEMAELEQWYLRADMAQSRRGQRCP